MLCVFDLASVREAWGAAAKDFPTQVGAGGLFTSVQVGRTRLPPRGRITLGLGAVTSSYRKCASRERSRGTGRNRQLRKAGGGTQGQVGLQATEEPSCLLFAVREEMKSLLQGSPHFSGWRCHPARHCSVFLHREGSVQQLLKGTERAFVWHRALCVDDLARAASPYVRDTHAIHHGSSVQGLSIHLPSIYLCIYHLHLLINLRQCLSKLLRVLLNC